MKELLISIDKAGRIVLPKDVRQQLALSPGDLLKLTLQGTSLTLAPNEKKAGFQKKGKALVFTATGGQTFGPETVDTLLNDLREDQIAKSATSHSRRGRKE